MEITFDDKFYKTFLAKWTSHSKTIEIEGFNLLGGTLFHLQLVDAEISLVTKESQFKGSREAFKQVLMKQSPHSINIEGLTFLDWIARAGLPDLSLLHRPVMEKQDNQFVLYFFKAEGDATVLTQKVLIERKTFRVTEAAFFDPSGSMQAKIMFDDYRPLPGVTSRASEVPLTGDIAFQQTLFPFFIKIEIEDRQRESPLQMEIVFKELRANNRDSRGPQPPDGKKPNDHFGD